MHMTPNAAGEMGTVRSLAMWGSAIGLIAVWIPLLAVRRVLDRDPVRYATGLMFRRLGRAMTKVNPSWRLHIGGETVADPRRPYVVVSNHQSLADIPLISNLPWEMKWMAKEELFRLPGIGWMLRLAGDIAVDRKNARSGAKAMLRAQWYLERKCSVMIFPEGTRTTDGRVRPFADGAFHLAVRAGVPILPLAVEGSFNCIPKHSWKFGTPSDIRLDVLPPVDVTGMTVQDVPRLRDSVRAAIIQRISTLRGASPSDVDGMVPSATPR